MTRRRLLLPLAALLAAAAVPARAAAPPPVDSNVFAFPGAFAMPASAASAGLALSDRWLGLDPAANPAARPARGVVLAPLGLRTSRQDLAADNREFDEQFGYVDFASGSLSLPFGRHAVTLYAWQPALRRENSSYTSGPAGSPTSAAVAHDGETRELRAGLAVSHGAGAWRGGVAFEWTQFTESDLTETRSGDPFSGRRLADFDGSAFAGAAGVTYDHGSERPRGWRAGFAAHWDAALDASGLATVDLLATDSTAAIAATRDARFEAGASAAWTLTAESHLYLSLGTRPAETWSEFGVASRTGLLWAAGADYHDAELPWTARLGVGQEQRPGTPEPRAGMIGAGFDWASGETTFSVGLLHRTVERPGAPKLADDRLVGSVAVRF